MEIHIMERISLEEIRMAAIKPPHLLPEPLQLNRVKIIQPT
jgi:hypothetical protein